MFANDAYFLVGQLSRLVENRHRDERLADIVQERSPTPRQAALVVLAHPEMMRERHRKTGDKQAVAIALDVMAADDPQPFTQRGLLDRPEKSWFQPPGYRSMPAAFPPEASRIS